MKKLSLETQRQVNGGWCLKSNAKFSAIHHYVNGRLRHTDWYTHKSGSWYYYG